MYSIWTTIYGIKVPTELTSKLENVEISEMFYEFELPSDFECNIPYSGDADADLHLGVRLFSTEEAIGNRSAKERKVNDKVKEIVTVGIQAIKDQMTDGDIEGWEEYCDFKFTNEEKEIIKEFKKCLDQKPEVYKAYSTS